MPTIGQTWVLTSIGAVVEMGILSTLKRLLMESRKKPEQNNGRDESLPFHHRLPLAITAQKHQHSLTVAILKIFPKT
jgi:hypothetical protein